MPRIYKGSSAKLAVMFYPSVIQRDKINDLKITFYSENGDKGVTVYLDNITIEDNIAHVFLSKYQVDELNDGVLVYNAQSVIEGKPYTMDRYTDYVLHTPADYKPDDLSKYVTEEELEIALRNDRDIYLTPFAVSQVADSVYRNGITISIDLFYAINDNKVIIVPMSPNFQNYNYNGGIVADTHTLVVTDGDVTSKILSFNLYDVSSNTVYQGKAIFGVGEYEAVLMFNSYILQERLASGYNIKTINGESLLGTGDIEIEMETVKPDWNVLDSTSTSYIANKTHYADVFTTCQSEQQMYINIPEEFVGDINTCRIRYNDTLYRLPDTVGEDVYYPNENDWVVSFRLNKNQSDGTFRDIELYCRSSVVDDTSFFEFLTTGFNYRCLDSFYLPKDVVYEDKLKTINGNSILGSGNITIKTDVDLSGYVTTDALNSKGYLTSVPSEYVTETELSGMGYVTQSYVDAQVGDIETILDNIIGNK